MKKYITALFLAVFAMTGKVAAEEVNLPTSSDYVIKTQDTHFILGFSVDGSEIEFEDRSCWRIPNSAFNVTQEWRRGDPILVMPTTCMLFAGDYPYTLYNARTRSEVQTIMEICPDRNGPYTKTVYRFDPHNCRLTLVKNNGAQFTFNVHPSDYAITHDWESNDRIFIAKNQEYWAASPSHKLLLINAETATQVRANE